MFVSVESVENEDKMFSGWYKLLLVVALKCSCGGALCPDPMWTAGCTETRLMYSQLKFMALIILSSRWSWKSLAEMVLSNTKASSFSFSYNYRFTYKNKKRKFKICLKKSIRPDIVAFPFWSPYLFGCHVDPFASM